MTERQTPRRFDPRALMELAVEVMDSSLAEPRIDKASPKVGAVIWLPDGTTDTACRGELRDGDHAEFTLLERKHRDRKLDDAVLFTTLEPCAPGSRRHPKVSCAERICLARIKEVWIGITDPDPTVAGKGLRYLKDRNVSVSLFDRDLQDLIEEANHEFLDQALERAAAAVDPGEQEPVLGSALESKLTLARLSDLDDEALRRYGHATGIEHPSGSWEFNRLLELQGLLHESDGEFVPSGFGLLLFGGAPRSRLPQAGLLATVHYADGTEETRDFDGPAVLVPEAALKWVEDKLPNPISRTSAARRGANDVLFELLREGIVNALVHRDYDIEGAKCQLSVSPDKVVVMSPGLPIEPITVERLASFEAPMLSRNPVMHYVFAKMKLAEERGLGLKSLRSRASAAGLPLPSYSYRPPYVVLTLYRDALAAGVDVRPDAVEQLNESEKAGWRWIARQETVTSRQYAEAMEVPDRTARAHLGRLTELGLLRRTGKGRATRYERVRA